MEVLLLFAILVIFAALIVIVLSLRKATITITVNLKTPAQLNQNATAPATSETMKPIEQPVDEFNLMHAARQIQELFLDDSQLSEKQEVNRNV